MKEEDRKLWIERINDYRASGLTAVKWDEDRICPECENQLHEMSKEIRKPSRLLCPCEKRIYRYPKSITKRCRNI